MKIIKIKEDHYVIVDETIQPVNGWYYDKFIEKIRNTNGAEYNISYLTLQITHSTQPLASMKELMEKGYDNILPINIDEIKKLIGEVDVEKKAKEEYKDNLHNPFFTAAPMGYVKGYNQALEDNKEKKYTEEDLLKAYEYGSNALLGISKINLIQSLQPKTEWKYVGECKGNNGDGCFMDSPGHDCGCYKRVPKTGWEVEIIDGKLKLV
jgi:hypothetical protein